MADLQITIPGTDITVTGIRVADDGQTITVDFISHDYTGEEARQVVDQWIREKLEKYLEQYQVETISSPNTTRDASGG